MVWTVRCDFFYLKNAITKQIHLLLLSWKCRLMELIINTIILILLLNRSYSIYCSGSTQSGKVRRLFSHIFPVHLTNNAGSVLGKKQCSDCLLPFLRPIETATTTTTTTTTTTSVTSATTATAVATAQVRGCKWSQVTGLCSHFALLLNKLETQKKFEAKNGRINDSLRIIKRNISCRRWNKRKLILSWVELSKEYISIWPLEVHYRDIKQTKTFQV